jgi:hypothetical protein
MVACRGPLPAAACEPPVRPGSSSSSRSASLASARRWGTQSQLGRRYSLAAAPPSSHSDGINPSNGLDPYRGNNSPGPGDRQAHDNSMPFPESAYPSTSRLLSITMLIQRFHTRIDLILSIENIQRTKFSQQEVERNRNNRTNVTKWTLDDTRSA